MTKAKHSGAFKGHRFPPEIIAYAVWSYFRFSLSLRDVEDLLAARGIIVSYETIRKWVGKFGTKYTASIRRDRPAPSDKWHLDEVVIPICGRKFWLWRAIDSDGDALDILVQSRRNTRAAKRFFRKLFKQYGRPRVVITDKLGSYSAALKSLAPGIDHRRHKGLNNTSEGSHRPTRRREKIMARFKSPGCRFPCRSGSVAQIARDSLRDSKVLVGLHEQAHTSDLSHDELARLQFRPEATRFAADLV